MTTYATVDELKASDEYQALGVIGRERLLWATFPELEAQHKARTAEHLESTVYPEAQHA